jgi:hypothetical protein
MRPMLWSNAGRSNSESASQVEPAALVQLSAIAIRTLQSAQFWELPNFRSWFFVHSLWKLLHVSDYIGAIISLLEEETAQIDSLDLHSVLMQKAITHAVVEKVDRALPSYWVLQYVPIEYLNRPSRANLVRRAVVCDVVLGASVDVAHAISKAHYLRVFMKMAGDWIGGMVGLFLFIELEQSGINPYSRSFQSFWSI